MSSLITSELGKVPCLGGNGEGTPGVVDIDVGGNVEARESINPEGMGDSVRCRLLKFSIAFF